jgi:outer membrane protein assembly factor BamB
VIVPFLLADSSLADWPQFRGPTGQGTSVDKGLPTNWSGTQNIVWKVEPPYPGASTPIIVGKHIYVTGFSGYGMPFKPKGDMNQLKLHLSCLDLGSGKALWTRDIEPKLPEQLAMRENHGYASSSPVVDGDRIYCFFGKSGVHAFDLKGKPLWQADVGSGRHEWGTAASPIVYGDLVIVNASMESKSLVALNKNTGKEVWRAGGINEAWNTPIVVKNPAGKDEIVVAIMTKILGFDPANGQQLWSCKTDIPWYMVPGLCAEDGVVYCVGGRSPGGGLAVRSGGTGDVTASLRLWKYNRGSNVTSPVFHNGHFYWMHDSDGIAFCVEAKTGKQTYAERVPGASQVYASAVLGDGKIYYVTRTGRTFVVAAQPEFKLLATNDLTDRSDRSRFDASPAIADGKVFVRSERYLYCIGK